MIKKILVIILSVVFLLSIISSGIILNMFLLKLLGVKYNNVISLCMFVIGVKLFNLPIKIIFVRKSKKIINTDKKKYFGLYILIYLLFLYFINHILDIFMVDIIVSNNVIFIISIISIFINITIVFSKRKSRLFS